MPGTAGRERPKPGPAPRWVARGAPHTAGTRPRSPPGRGERSGAAPGCPSPAVPAPATGRRRRPRPVGAARIPPPRAVGSPPGSLGAARGRRLSPAVPAGGCRDAPGSFGAPTMERDRRATNVGVGPSPDPRGGDLWCVSTVGEKVRGSPAAAPFFHLHPSPFIPFHPRPSPRTAWLCYGPVFPRNRAWQR